MPTRDSYEPGRPCWVDLATSDPEAARSFYGELFGWTAEVDPDPAAGGYSQFHQDGARVAGCGPAMGEGAPSVWTTYIASDDVDATATLIEASGGTTMVPPMDIFEAGRMGLFADPTGAVFGVWQAKQHTGAELVNEPTGWTWSHLLTGDKAKAIEFYGAVFGWEERNDPTWGDYIALGDGEIASASEMDDSLPAGVPPHWSVAFSVPDAGEAQARAVQLGGTAVGPVDDMGPAKQASAMDPQGAMFGFLSMPAEAPAEA